MLEDLYNLSFYKEITVLNKEHKIYLVQHIETGRTFVKKEMTIYNKSVFEQLKNRPIVGIPRIYEVCENDGVLTIIEEYISGITLDEYIQQRGIISESDTVTYVDQLCSILSKLHSFSPAIIHRDIKPSNIMLTDDNRIVLIDLNGAKTEVKGQTRDTELIGTQGFAAPEQYGFGASNIQTDIYSVGKLMVVMLTGNLDGINKYSGRLKPVIECCLNIDPKNRYENALQLQKAVNSKSGRKPANNKQKRSFPKKAVSITVTIIAVLILIIVVLSTPSKSDKKTESSTSSVTIDYTSTEAFETALNNGEDLKGKTVSFTVDELHPNSPYGYNIWAGEHLNFVSKDNPNVNEGDIMTVRTTKIKKNILDSWIIKYEKIKNIPVDTTEYDEQSESSQLLQERSEITVPVDEYIESPVGAYKGDDDEILVIAEDGLAYYYCIDESYTELECPWTLSDDLITISFSKMHCDASASISKGCSSLIFRSDSSNWNTEEFIWFTSEYEKYIKDTPPSASKDVSVLTNGNMQIILDNMQFTIPKNFVDYGDSYSTREDGIDLYTFVDNDADNGYLSNAVFYSESAGLTNTLDKNYKTTCKSFAGRFMTNVQLGHSEPISVAGYNGYSTIVSGLLNDGFNALEGSIFSGPVIVVYDDSSNNYIFLFFPQVVGTNIDDSELFESIISSAKIL